MQQELMIKQQSSEKLNIVLTGGNSGIGYEVCKHLYNQGHNVIFGSRNVQKNQQAVKNISQSGKGYIKSYPLDLAKRKSIQEFVQNIKKQFPDHIDQLINNSGLFMNEKRMSQLNVQMTMTVNHFGHFYLTYLLFDLLKKSKQARVLHMSSDAYKGVTQKSGFYDNLTYQNKGYSGLQSYCLSKLANVHFTRGLAMRLSQNYPHIKTVSIHPGVVETDFGRKQDAKGCFFRCLNFFKLCCFCCVKDPQQGALTTIYTSQVEFSKLRNGQYYVDEKQEQLYKHGKDQTEIEKLWAISEKLYGIKFKI